MLARGLSTARFQAEEMPHDRRRIEPAPFQVVAAFDSDQFRSRRDQRERGRQLGNGSERIGIAMNEYSRHVEVRKMGGPKLIGLVWRMQRIGKE